LQVIEAVREVGTPYDAKPAEISKPAAHLEPFLVFQYLPGGAVLNALARKTPKPFTASIFEWTLSSVMFMAFLSVNECRVLA
jgi:hypothetical protein